MKSLLAFTLIGLAFSAQAADLDIDVQGLASSDGHVMVAVYVDGGSWLKKPVATATQAASERRGDTLRVHLTDLPEGTIAVSLFHDVNGNGRLDANAMGMPQEPFGFSNNAVGQFGPPKFEKASFELKGAAKTLSIKLN